MASNTMVAVSVVVMLAAMHGCTATDERVHFRIVVPEFINTMTHTKTVYVMPKKGKSYEDSGLGSGLGGSDLGGTGLGGTYGGAMGTGYGAASAAGYGGASAAGYGGASAAGYGGSGPSPTAAGYGTTGHDSSGHGGYGFVHPSGQGVARPSGLGVGVTGSALTTYGHSAAQQVAPGPSPTPPPLPVIIPLRAPPLPPPPPPGTIIVAAGHDASLAELLSHSTRVRSALRAQRLLRYNRLQPTGGTVTANPVAQVTQSVHSPRLQSQQGSPTIPPELQPVYGYYGLNNGQRYQPITVYQGSGASQASKQGSKCHGGNLVGVSGNMLVQDGHGVKNGQHYHHHHAVYTPPQTSVHGTAYVNSQSHGQGYFGNGGSYGVYAGFTTPQSVSVNSAQGHALYNAYSALPVPPAYSALQGNQNVRPTLPPMVTTSGQISNAGYTTTQVYPTAQYPHYPSSNHVYHGTQYRQPQYSSYGNKLPNPYGPQTFSIKDGRHSFPGSPQHYNLPQQQTVSIKPKDKNKTDKKSPVVKCRKDDKNGLICIASANVQKNTENATKVYVGDAWTKTKHVKTKDKGIHKVNTKIKGKVTLPKKHKKKKGDEDKSSAASGESMSGSAEEQTVGDIPPASEESSTPHANLEAGDFSASMTTSSYGAAGSEEQPEAQQASQENEGGDYSGDQDSQQVGRTEANDMDVEGDGDSMKKGFRLQSDQWTPINPARLEQDDSAQDQPGEKRDTSGGKDYGTTEYHATPTPLKSTTVVLGVTRDYKPLQAFFGRQVSETTPAPTKVSNLKYGDMYWSMVRGKVDGGDEVTKQVNDIITHEDDDQPSVTEASVKLSNGLGIDEHLSLVNGWGSHIDGTEDALARPEAFPPESKPADLSSEVHLTTASPDGIALYYQNEAEEEANTQRHEIKQDEEEAEENNINDEDTKDDAHLSTTLPSAATGPRYRGRVKYSDRLTTSMPEEDSEVESRKIAPSQEAVEGPAEDPAEEVTEDAPEESQEADDDAEGTDKPEALVDELRKDIESTKEDLESALESRAKNSGPKIISESGHILRGLAVNEQLDVQKW